MKSWGQKAGVKSFFLTHKPGKPKLAKVFLGTVFGFIKRQHLGSPEIISTCQNVSRKSATVCAFTASGQRFWKCGSYLRTTPQKRGQLRLGKLRE